MTHFPRWHITSDYWPHPFFVMQHFVKETIFTLPLVNNITMPRNITNMAKLLIFPSFVRASAKLRDTSVMDVVKMELDNYPYKLKENFTVRANNSFVNFR